MSRIPAPYVNLPTLRLAPSGFDPSPESVHAAREDLRLLVIDATALSAAERQQLWPRDCDMRDWYIQAVDSRVSLVVLRTGNTIELYSTQQDRQVAFAPTLMALAARTRLLPELRRVQLVPRRGLDVARHLFALAAGIGATRGKTRVLLARIEAASLLSGKAGSLSPTVDSLFRTALKVGRRVDAEALVGQPNLTESLPDVAEICATRIIEEELLIWKTEQIQMYLSLSRAKGLGRRRGYGGALLVLDRGTLTLGH